jgi:hypothetical protein
VPPHRSRSARSALIWTFFVEATTMVLAAVRGRGVVVAIDGIYVAALVATVAVIGWAGWRRRPRSARSERGAADDSFMKKVVKVSLIVMLVAGGMVWLIDRADDGPASGSDERSPDHRHHNPGGNNR